MNNRKWRLPLLFVLLLSLVVANSFAAPSNSASFPVTTNTDSPVQKQLNAQKYNSVLADINRAQPISPVQIRRETNSTDELNTLVTIGTGTTLTSNFPIYWYWDNSMGAAIYTAAEVGGAGTITSVAFQASAAESFTSTLPETTQVWLAEVSYSSFSVASSYLTLLGTAGIICAGGDTIISGSGHTWNAGWVNINLNHPFAYSGTNNLMVIFRSGQANWVSGSNNWYYTTTATNQFQYSGIDNVSSFYSTAATITTARPNVQLTMMVTNEPFPPSFVSPANNAIGLPITTTLSWTPNANTDNCDVYLSTVQADVASSAPAALVAGATTATSFAPTLLLNQTYYWKVVARNTTSGLTNATGVWTFNTIPALTGTKVIDPTPGVGDYTSFTNAIAALNTAGVGSGGITFLVNPATYNEQVTLAPFPGMGSTAPVTFRNNGGTVNVSPTTAALGAYGIKLNGVKYVTFDGINFIDPTVTATSLFTYGYWITNNAAAQPSQYNTIKNATIRMRAKTATMTTITYGVYHYYSYTPSSQANANNYNRYLNLKISKCVYGVYVYSNSSYPDQGTEIGSDSVGVNYANRFVIGAMGTADTIGGLNLSYGIYAYYTNGITIHDIDITGMKNYTSAYVQYGIYLYYANYTASTTGVYIYNNRIYGFRAGYVTTASAQYGMYFYQVYNTATYPTALSRVYNNMIYDFQEAYTGTIATYYQYGIYVSGYNPQVVNNTIWMNQAGTQGFSNACLYLVSQASNDTVKNNIFANTGSQSSTTPYHIGVYNGNANAAYLKYDNNVFYIPNVGGTTGGYYGYSGAYRNTFSAWQTAYSPNYDMNSVLGNPQFISTTLPYDTRILTDQLSSVVDNNGTPMSWVSTDIENEARSGTTPDIGADEGQFLVVGAPRMAFSTANPLTYYSAPVAFGTRAVGTAGTAVLYISNTGSSTALSITNVSATTVTPSWFTRTIPAGGIDSLFVSWNPGIAGALADNIVITSNAGNYIGPVSVTVTGTAVVAGTLPLGQTFNGSLPATWTTSNGRGASSQWTYYSSMGNGGNYGSVYKALSTADPMNATCNLWTPPVSTAGLGAGYMTFDWYFYNAGTVSPDTFQVGYSLDGGITYIPFWWRVANGTGGTAGTDLRTSNSSNGTTTLTWIGWASAGVNIPAEAIGQSQVVFGFRTVKGAAVGTCYLGLDNVIIVDPSQQLLTFTQPGNVMNPLYPNTSVKFGTRPVGIPASMALTVNNPGGNPLTINSVTALHGNVGLDWNANSVDPSGSMILNLTWTPSSPGTLVDTLWFQSDAYNGANIYLPISGIAVAGTSVPLSMGFPTTWTPPAYPTGWSATYNVNPGYPASWSWGSNGNGGANGQAYLNLYQTANGGSQSVIWAPPVSTTGIVSASLNFDWCYSNYPTVYTPTDTMNVVYSLDGGLTWSYLWSRYYSNTGNASDLRTNTLANYSSTPSIAGWASTSINLPVGCLNQPVVMFGWQTYKSQNYGSYLGLDNVSIQNTGLPIIQTAQGVNLVNTSTPFHFGSHQNGVPTSLWMKVNNTGNSTLHISNVTSTGATVTPSWTSRVVGATGSDSIQLTVTLPLGVYHDTLNIISDASNGSPWRVAIDGNGIVVHALGYSQNFTGAFPPSEWSVVQNPVDSYTWNQYAGTPTWAYIAFWSYLASNAKDYLISPTFTTVGQPAAELDFNWSYIVSGTYDDTLIVCYSIDGGTTWSNLWLRRGQGTGSEALMAGTGAGTTNPATSNFGLAQITLPPACLNQPAIQFAFLGITNYGPDIFVTNFSVFNPNVPRLVLNPSAFAYGQRVVGSYDSVMTYVTNPGIDTLRITNITANIVTRGWTVRNINPHDSAALWVYWSPSVAGALADTIRVTSNAADLNTFLVTGTAVAPLAVPFNESFASSSPWPPTAWTATTTNVSYPWSYTAYGNGAADGAAYINTYYLGAPGRANLWTPFINTVGLAAAELDFDWWYDGYYATNDSLVLAYSLDGGATYTPIWERSGTGTGVNDLRTNMNTSLYYQYPSTTPSEWATARISLPAGALGKIGVMFGWLSYAPTTYTGSLIGIDHIAIYNSNGPQITLNPSTLSYANITAGSVASRNVVITNTGVTTLHISSMTATTVVPARSSDSVAVGATDTLAVTWSPLSGGINLVDTLVFVSDALNGTTKKVPISGNSVALTVPVSGFLPASAAAGSSFTFTADVQSNIISQDSIISVVANVTGTNTATVTLLPVGGSLPGTRHYSGAQILSTIGANNYSITVNYYVVGISTPFTTSVMAGPAVLPAQTGGPDAFGYTFITSNATGGPAYNWLTPSGGASVIPRTEPPFQTGLTYPYDDDWGGPFNIGFSFPFYGTNYTQFCFDVNGGISLGSTGMTSYSSSSPGVSTAGIWFYPGDLIFPATATAVYELLSAPTRCVITLTGIANYAATNYSNMQIILYADGKIDLQYGSPFILNSSGYGTGISNGTINCAYGPENYLTASMLVRYNPPPVIALSGNSINYNFVAVAGTGNAAITVFNNGASQLHITNVSVPATVTPGWTTQTINSGGNAILSLAWNPIAEGSFAGNVVITSNASNAPSDTITLSGYAYLTPGVPVITISYTKVDSTTHLSWPQPTGTIDGYKIYRHDSTGLFLPTAPRLIGTNVGAANTTFVDVGRPGADFYVVTSYNAASASSTSVSTIPRVATIKTINNNSSDRVNTPVRTQKGQTSADAVSKPVIDNKPVKTAQPSADIHK